jgi:hypothetical protein
VADETVPGAYVLSGWHDFIESFARLPTQVRTQMRKPLRNAAQGIVNASKPYAMNLGAQGGGRATGHMASSTSIRVGVNRVKIVWTTPYAGVMEFAHDYERKTRSGGTSTVHLLPNTPTPRFAYKAWNQVENQFMEEVLDSIAQAAAESGYWRLG